MPPEPDLSELFPYLASSLDNWDGRQPTADDRSPGNRAWRGHRRADRGRTAAYGSFARPAVASRVGYSAAAHPGVPGLSRSGRPAGRSGHWRSCPRSRFRRSRRHQTSPRAATLLARFPASPTRRAGVARDSPASSAFRPSRGHRTLATLARPCLHRGPRRRPRPALSVGAVRLYCRHLRLPSQPHPRAPTAPLAGPATSLSPVHLLSSIPHRATPSPGTPAALRR